MTPTPSKAALLLEAWRIAHAGQAIAAGALEAIGSLSAIGVGCTTEDEPMRLHLASVAIARTRRALTGLASTEGQSPAPTPETIGAD